MSAEVYVQELLEEKDILQPHEYAHTIRLLEDEINRVRSDGQPAYKDLAIQGESISSLKRPKYKEEVIKLTEKIMVPVKEYPKFNFVGKILGPKGNTLKRLQASTQTKISILGRGSTRDKEKEEELSQSDDPKHEHLKESLHVSIQVEAPKSEAHKRLGTALAELNKYLVPENDEIRQDQMREMAMLNGPVPTVISRPSNPIIRVGIPPPGAIVINELPGAGGGRAADPYSYDKYSAIPTAAYETYTEKSRYDYPADASSPRKRSALSNSYPVKKYRESYSDYQ